MFTNLAQYINTITSYFNIPPRGVAGSEGVPSDGVKQALIDAGTWVDERSASAEVNALAAATALGNSALAGLISVKTAAEALLTAATALVNAGANPKGGWNAATNSPALTSTPSAAGDVYDVTVAGTQSITGVSTAFNVGDRLKSNGTAWFRIPFGIGDGTVSKAKLATDISQYLTAIANSTFDYSVTDLNDNVFFGVQAGDSKFWAVLADAVVTTASIKNGNVTLDKLATSIQNQIGTVIDAELTGWVYVVTDLNDNIYFGQRTDGTFFVNIDIASLNGSKILPATLPGTALIDKSVSLPKLPDDFVRLNQPNILDTTLVEPDDLWRGNEVALPVKTSVLGVGFERFPSLRTPFLRGINGTGTSIQVRKSSKLTVHGKRYVGTFNPSSAGVSGLVKKGSLGNAVVTLPSSVGLISGDYYEVLATTTASRSIGGLTAKRGDLVVWNGSAFVVQPGPSASSGPGDFWNIAANGTFAGVAYTTSDRLVQIATVSDGGNGKSPRFLLQKNGEFFLMGEFNPGTFAPSDIREGDLYIASTAGTFSTIVFAENDYLIRQDGAWGKIICDTVITVAAGAYFHGACHNASDYEVRRTDKNVTVATIALKGITQNAARRHSDNIVFRGDSMLNTVTSAGNALDAALSGLIAPRTLSSKGYGGATAEEILSMIYYEIRTDDTNASKINFFFFGRNNPMDYYQTIQAALTALTLIGSKETRYGFMSVMPNRSLSYNGTRLVNAEGENSKAGTGDLVTLENWYTAAIPGNFFNTRLQLLTMAASRTALDPTFPGLTEAQVASTYGILPFSYHFDWTTKSFTAASLNFLGYYGTAGLPSGGSNNDYYLRSANGTIGTLIVKVAGVWTEYDYDRTHMTSVGNSDLATAINNFLTLKKW